MLRGGETVLTAVSGGADSVALADVLVSLVPELDLKVHLVHVNHGLRPEADAEQLSVERLAGDLCVPCDVERVTVRRGPPWAGLARSTGLERALMNDREEAGARQLARLGRQGGAGWVFGIADLRALPREIAAETLRAAALSLGHSGAMRGAGQRALRRLLAPDIPRGLVSAGGLVMERSGRWLRVGRGRVADLEPREFVVPGTLALPEIGAALAARCLEAGSGYR